MEQYLCNRSITETGFIMTQLLLAGLRLRGNECHQREIHNEAV